MRVEWIDRLKAMAILMVIAVHVSQVLTLPTWLHLTASFGAMGVQLFFLLSSYCLCMTWRNNPITIRYWIHKYKRLAPWYIVGICLYAAFWLFVGDTEKAQAFTVPNIVSNILLVNSFFPEAQNSIVPGGWSISCIALFVFMAPLFMCRLTIKKAVVLLSFGCAGVLFSVVGYCCLGWSRFYAYCSPFNQTVVFTIGVLYWALREQINKKININTASVIGIIFFLGSIASVVLGREYAIFYRHILISCSFVAFMSVFSRLKAQSRFIGDSILLWIGRHSYEVFILHFAAIWSVKRMFA